MIQSLSILSLSVITLVWEIAIYKKDAMIQSLFILSLSIITLVWAILIYKKESRWIDDQKRRTE